MVVLLVLAFVVSSLGEFVLVSAGVAQLGEGAVFVGVARCAVGAVLEAGVDGAGRRWCPWSIPPLWPSKLCGAFIS